MMADKETIEPNAEDFGFEIEKQELARMFSLLIRLGKKRRSKQLEKLEKKTPETDILGGAAVSGVGEYGSISETERGDRDD